MIYILQVYDFRILLNFGQNILNSDPFPLNDCNFSQSGNFCIINRSIDHFTTQITTAIELCLIILVEKQFR